MDPNYKFPGSPGAPLFQASPERVNQQRSSIFESPSTSPSRSDSGRHTRESSVHDKVAAFNNLAFQGKALERKANDAALKRAMLGREEAESEMRRYKDETRSLRRQVDEGKERERRVGERLEEVMEKHTRAKETYEHTKAVWEKDTRRSRKENFKTQSMLVKTQEELKSLRHQQKISQVELEQEKERSLKREQEAFAARYELVGVQEQLAQMQEQVKLVKQERDALKTIAQNEEIARIAAEGQIPLPKSQEQDDEFASPKKSSRRSFIPATVTSSAAHEEELDDMRMLLGWERQRAERAHDRIDFLEMECRLKCCAAARSHTATPAVFPAPNEEIKIECTSTVFIPSEGIFRTIPPSHEEPSWISPAKKPNAPLFDEAPRDRRVFSDAQRSEVVTPDYEAHLESLRISQPEVQETRNYGRTPSCEPPAPAMMADVSLLSIFDTPASPQNQPPSSPTYAETQNETTVIRSTQQEDCERVRVIETFHTVSTTTRIPLAAAPDTPVRTPLLPVSLDPALGPTMSREEALAQIRARRGRAKSIAQGTMTPRKQMVECGLRRDISAPAIRSGNVRGRSQARTPAHV